MTIKYISVEQQITVESRLARGYKIIDQASIYDIASRTNGHGGAITISKGSHTMKINSMGYDTYVPAGMVG